MCVCDLQKMYMAAKFTSQLEGSRLCESKTNQEAEDAAALCTAAASAPAGWSLILLTSASLSLSLLDFPMLLRLAVHPFKRRCFTRRSFRSVIIPGGYCSIVYRHGFPNLVKCYFPAELYDQLVWLQIKRFWPFYLDCVKCLN